MMKAKPDTPELEPTTGVERRIREGRSVKRGGSVNLIRRPKRKQLERSLTGTYNQAVKDECRRDVKILVGGRTEKLPAIQAVLRQLSNEALNGGVRAQRELLTQYRFERNIAVKNKLTNYDFNLLTYNEVLLLRSILVKASPIKC